MSITRVHRRRRRHAAALGALLLLLPTPSSAQPPLPDLIVREDVLGSQWVVRDENLPADFCSVIEGEVTPGLHRLLRFTVMTPNVGNANVHIGNPQDHVDANDGLYELATCHAHYHFQNYAKYELIDPRTGTVWRAAKRGFCMIDTDPNPASLGDAPPRDHYYRSCGSTATAGNQGISAGWADTYRFFLGGQYFVLDGGDGQPAVPPGRYIIRITANPPYQPAVPGASCPRAMDPLTGDCHQLEESDYTNNIAEVTVDIPAHPGRSGFGPMAGTPIPAEDLDEHGNKIKKVKQ